MDDCIGNLIPPPKNKGGRPKGSVNIMSKRQQKLREKLKPPTTEAGELVTVRHYPEVKTAHDLLKAVYLDSTLPIPMRVRAATDAANYENAKLAPKLADGLVAGKKEQMKHAARSAGVGKFATPAVPRLAVNNG